MSNYYRNHNRHSSLLAVAISMLALVSCGTRQETVTAPPPPAPVPMPQPPAGAALVQSIPSIAPDGRWMTPNHGLSAPEALWHVRVALNVAALGCRNDPGDAQRLQYNRFLAQHKAALAGSNAAVDSLYRQRFGGSATTMRDTRTTQAYNFFALPPAQAGFCVAATQVGAMLLTIPSDQLATYAPVALQQLEQPFADFYTAYASYRRDLERWQTSRRYASAQPMPEAVPQVVQPPVVVQPVAYQPPVQQSPVVTPPRMTPAVATGRYVVQLGAYDSLEAARTAWSAIIARHPEHQASPLVNSSAMVNGKRYYRVGISGFATQAEAARTCTALKAKGATCFARTMVPDDTAVRWAAAQ